MNIYNIIKEENIECVISSLREDKTLITKLFSYEDRFSSVLNFVLKNKKENQYIELFSLVFFDILVGQLIRKPSDLLCCLQKVKSKSLQLAFLNMVVRHRLVNDDFLIALGESKFVFERLPQDMGWTEVPIGAYGSMVIRSLAFPLSVEQICPLLNHADADTVQWLLGWAFEVDKLNEEGIAYLKMNFPKKYEMILHLKQSH